MSEQCCLCEGRREDDSEFCNLHRTALANLENAYVAWSKAFGGMDIEEYYAKLNGLHEVGLAVRDVLQYLQDKKPPAVRP